MNEFVIPLLDEESSTIIKGENGITTITFYRGDRERAAAVMRARLEKIINVNPWLAGRLIKNKNCKNLQLAYPSAPLPDRTIGQIFDDNPSSIRIGSEMEYNELFKEAKPAIIQKATKLINKPDLITRLTMVSDMHSPQKGFALIFSISHVAADGYTYYKIFNQLFTDKPVRCLDVQRKQMAADKVTEVVGPKAFKFFHSTPFILNLLRGAIFGKKTKCYAFYVSPAKITEAKNRVAGSSESGSDFVSTNDILSSSFAKAAGSRICIMAVNLRTWIAGISGNDAGNYAGGLLFDDETSFAPLKMRKAFQAGLPLPTTEKPLPGFVEALRCKVSLISNWSDLQESHDMQGCEQVLHLPLYDAREAFPLDSAVIFKARPDKLAVMYFTKTLERDKLVADCEIGETISAKTFH